jgi:diguanylate cyclase (GGDEF)-like protein
VTSERKNNVAWAGVGILAGLFVCLLVGLKEPGRLPWLEIVGFAFLATALRQRPVPLIKDRDGGSVYAHVPGEFVLMVLLLRHGPEAAACASLFTNVLGALLQPRYFLRRSCILTSLSGIFWLPFLAYVTGWCYYGWGGISMRTLEDAARLFRDPLHVLLPFFGARVFVSETLNRLYQVWGFHLRGQMLWRRALRELPFEIFEHLENLGGLLSLAIWTAWGWTTLPFSFLVMEALLQSARQHVQHKETRKQATSDPLTGLVSARGLSESLDAWCKRTGKSFTVLYLDLDRFKLVNDTYGHAVGDALLVLLGEALRAGVRPEDIVGRRGGDEFVVLLQGLDRALAEPICERLRLLVEAKLHEDERFRGVRLSQGISVFPTDGATEEALLDVADRAMYAEKRKHRQAA